MADKKTKSDPLLPPIPKEDDWEKYPRIEQWRRGHLSVMKELHKNVRYDIDNLANDISNNANDVSNNANDISNNAGDVSNNANDIANNANDITNRISGFGNWSNDGVYESGANYTANEDGFVFVAANTTLAYISTPLGNPRQLFSFGANTLFSMMCAVKDGDVWRVDSNDANETSVWWIPLE